MMSDGLSVSPWAASMRARSSSATSSTYSPVFFQSTDLHVPAVGLVARLATSSVKATLVSSSIEIWFES